MIWDRITWPADGGGTQVRGGEDRDARAALNSKARAKVGVTSALLFHALLLQTPASIPKCAALHKTATAKKYCAY